MARRPTAPPAQPSVVIVGAGFAGLGMAMELLAAGHTDITVLERADDVGGVWRENTYPGAGCDIPTPLYSYSHTPKTDWPRRFALQPDILDYLRATAATHGVTDLVRFGAEVTAAEWDERAAQWTVRVEGGGEPLTADVLVMATGQLSHPALPNIPGIGTFAGPSFHSAQWDHGVDLRGKRVAVVGTGASAVQFVPAIAPDAAHLTLFQRSAPWILPKADVAYRPWHHAAFRWLPPVRLAERLAIWALCEVLALGLVDVPALQPQVVRLAQRHLRNQVPDEALRAKLTPDYPAGCKRGLFSNEYLPALTRPNVTVETTAIAEVTADGVRTADGVLHEVDAVVYGTGFKATEFLGPVKVFGRDGRSLQDAWSAEGARAYLGMAVPGFPNLFLMYGPNTNLGVGSIVHVIESQARHIRQAVRLLADRPGALEVRADVEERYDDALRRRLDRSPWNFCGSWYRNAAGRVTNNWPGTSAAYRLRTRRLRAADYTHTGTGA